MLMKMYIYFFSGIYATYRNDDVEAMMNKIFIKIKALEFRIKAYANISNGQG